LTCALLAARRRRVTSWVRRAGSSHITHLRPPDLWPQIIHAPDPFNNFSVFRSISDLNACTLPERNYSQLKQVCRALNFINIHIFYGYIARRGEEFKYFCVQGTHSHVRKMRLCFKYKQKEVYFEKRSASGGGVPARRDINLTF